MAVITLTMFSIVFWSSISGAHLCTEWSKPIVAGKLDNKLVSEASGLAISKRFSNRMYHNNDSGDGGYFYVTPMDGSRTQTVEVLGMEPADMEDIALGPCGSRTCLYLADIGDNKEKRKFVEVWAVEEQQSFESRAKLISRFKITYPDRPHNAEALAIHPKTGDVYILTKEEKKEIAYPAKLFVARASELFKEKLIERAQELEFVTDIAVPTFNSDLEVWGQIVTGMDFNSDGTSLLLLTYQNALELDFALVGKVDSRKWKEGVHYSRAALTYLQQEGIAFAQGDKAFYYTSELNPDEDEKASIFKVRCVDDSKNLLSLF